MQLWFYPLLAFLLGSIPFGLLISRSQGIDIRKHGSGNIGATNVLRVLGKKFGIPCLILDALKGFIPVVIAVNLVRIEGGRDPQIHLAFLDSYCQVLPDMDRMKGQFIHVFTALSAVLGHNYSPWIGFKGGKGIATSAGVLIGLMPAAVLILLIVFITILAITRYVSVASMVSALILPIMTHLGARFHKTPQGISLWESGTWNMPLLLFTMLIATLAIWKHRTNIVRLREGTESRFVWGGKKKPE